MPFRDTAAGRVRAAVRIGLTLTLAFAGCTREGETDGPGSEEVVRGIPHQPQIHTAPLIPPNPALTPPELPARAVPQNPEEQGRARAALLARLRDEWVGNYERHGNRNISWDAVAHQALEAWVRYQTKGARESAEALGWFKDQLGAFNSDRDFSWRGGFPGDDQIVAWKAAHQAIQSGCNDGLIQYVYARLSYGECQVSPAAALDHAWTAAATAMRGSKYPALLRARAYTLAAYVLSIHMRGRISRLPEAERLIDEALALVPDVVRECRDDPNRASTLYHLGTYLIEACKELPSASGEITALERAADRVLTVVPADGEFRVTSLLLAAHVLYRKAWLLRGRESSAIEVSADLWAEFEGLISQVEAKLMEIRELFPACPEIPRLMISIENIQGRDRERMETWFDQAMQVDGDDYLACLAKLDYLEPRWHGSEAEMLAFGRACLRTENWEGRLPFILTEAHRRISRSIPPSYQTRRIDVSYWSRPDVWKDCQAVYEPYLSRHRDARYDKTRFAKVAAYGGHLADANRLLDELGDNYWHSLFTMGEYQWVRDTARRGNLSDDANARNGPGGKSRFGGRPGP
jgi:hypothetical protein